MSPGTNSLIAAFVAVAAVLVACAAVGAVLLATRVRGRLAATRHDLARSTERVGRDVPRVRDLLGGIDATLVRLRRQDAAMDRRLVRMTEGLVPIRRTIEGVTRGRLALLLRGAGALSRAAQFALLWR